MKTLLLCWLLLSAPPARWQSVRAEDLDRGSNFHSPLCTLRVGEDDVNIESWHTE